MTFSSSIGFIMHRDCTAEDTNVCTLAKETSFCHSQTSSLFTFGNFEVGSLKFQLGNSALRWCLELSIPLALNGPLELVCAHVMNSCPPIYPTFKRLSHENTAVWQQLLEATEANDLDEARRQKMSCRKCRGITKMRTFNCIIYVFYPYVGVFFNCCTCIIFLLF